MQINRVFLVSVLIIFLTGGFIAICCQKVDPATIHTIVDLSQTACTIAEGVGADQEWLTLTCDIIDEAGKLVPKTIKLPRQRDAGITNNG